MYTLVAGVIMHARELGCFVAPTQPKYCPFSAEKYEIAKTFKNCTQYFNAITYNNIFIFFNSLIQNIR